MAVQCFNYVIHVGLLDINNFENLLKVMSELSLPITAFPPPGAGGGRTPTMGDSWNPLPWPLPAWRCPAPFYDFAVFDLLPSNCV